MAEQVPAVCDVLDAIERRNWTRLQRLLHPDIHWTTAVEEQLHGADEVVPRLSTIRRQPLPHTTRFVTGSCTAGLTVPADWTWPGSGGTFAFAERRWNGRWRAKTNRRARVELCGSPS